MISRFMVRTTSGYLILRGEVSITERNINIAKNIEKLYSSMLYVYSHFLYDYIYKNGMAV